jgi:DNA-binding IscR family transcriptional regulator
MRKDGSELQINRKFRRSPMLDQIRPHSLVHANIFKGVRGPHGGYQLARERRRITVGAIVRTAMSLSTAEPEDLAANSVLLERVIDPPVRRAGESFLADLDLITVEQMCETAEKTHVLDDEKVSGDFAI